DGAFGRVYMDGAHAREVDDNAIVAKGAAADVVAAASDSREQIVFAREVDGGDDVGDARTAGDQGRMFIDAGVPNPAGVVVAAVGGLEKLTVEGGFERLN